MENLIRLVTLSKELGLRLKAASLLPAGVLALLILALIVSGAPYAPPDVGRLTATVSDLGAGGGVILFLGLVFYFLIVSVVLEPLQVSLVRILEGDWGTSRLGRVLAGLGTTLKERRYEHLRSIAYREVPSNGSDRGRERAAIRKLGQSFPARERLLPTNLGNVLRVVEDRAGQRYGLDTVTVWPLLHPLLPDRLVETLERQSDQVDIAARFCVAFLITTGVSLLLLGTHGWWLLFPAFMLLLSWLSYRAAITAALSYGITLESAFALHRFDLRKALHLELPGTASQEVKLNRELSQYLQGWAEHELTYHHNSESRTLSSWTSTIFGRRRNRRQSQ